MTRALFSENGTDSMFRRKMEVVGGKLRWSKLSQYFWAVIRTVLLIGLAFLILFPLIVKISSSLKGYQDLLDPSVMFIPRNWSLISYKTVWEGIDYPSSLLTSIGFCTLIAVLQTFSCTLVGYGLARFKFVGRELIFTLVLITLVIPPQAILFPLYLKYKYFDFTSFFTLSQSLNGISLLDTIWPFVMLASTALGFKSGLYIYMLRQYFKTMPVEIEEAACVDGCGNIKIFFKIMLPGASTMMATVFLFSFVWNWTDYYYSAILAPNLQTLGMKLFGFSSRLIADHGNYAQNILQSPQFILLIVPLIILYLFTQRLFVESIEHSGIK